ncbi:hypothetical protein Pla175_14120 [Pirellulimonas nuda]|uniref:3-keto-alpha-glucoside-1,2-lyase/3-keto-2-hydroxy-glucal hydratase domain-containing protein n=1 Tax=Pirellulimonas nuda TaxID=2528009 RepID=A0A518D998_9BACT|nr:DUF1080 domain-containing protein [Pirellulimonas nuda]QDU88042.1 hypothetical protein Pla175_14120 [Pirellulimonas nuda]
MQTTTFPPLRPLTLRPVTLRLVAAACVAWQCAAADALFAAEQSPTASADQAELTALGYKPLFNGKSLDGWSNPYDHGKAEVVDGEIHLNADKKFFLVADGEYGDFELVADILLPAGEANSGVMFRCHVEPNRVYGYQAECDGSDRCWSGGLYDEGRRQWVWPSTKGRSEPEFLKYEAESQEWFKRPEVHDALRRDGWNRYEIQCRGDHIVIRLNGVKVTDLKDSTDAKGRIAIQHHGEKGKTYRFRNVMIKELPAAPAGEET